MEILSLFQIPIVNRFIRFFIVGGSGVFLNLLVTAFFFYFVLPENLFYISSIIGTAVNVLYNFTLHTIFTFQTKKHHKSRFVLFVGYTLGLATIQETLIAVITPYIGVEFFLIIKAVVILCFSILTFLVFHFVLFSRNIEQKF
ncbi:MAG: GtrA family protein [Candidatus Woesearchaeota archaeon]